MKSKKASNGNILLMVVVLVATLTIAIPYMFQANSQMARLAGKMRAKYISRSISLSAIDLVEQLFEKNILQVKTTSPWRVELQPAFTLAPTAFWEFSPGSGSNPSILTFYTCDPKAVAPLGSLPTETDCATELSGYVTTISFEAISPACDHVSARIETINAGTPHEGERANTYVSFSTGIIC